MSLSSSIWMSASSYRLPLSSDISCSPSASFTSSTSSPESRSKSSAHLDRASHLIASLALYAFFARSVGSLCHPPPPFRTSTTPTVVSFPSATISPLSPPPALPLLSSLSSTMIAEGRHLWQGLRLAAALRLYLFLTVFLAFRFFYLAVYASAVHLPT